MLLSLFKGKAQRLIDALDAFYSSVFYCLFMAVLIGCCAIFGLELYIYYVMALFGVVLPCLFGKDFRGLIAPLFYGYFSCSLKTNDATKGLSLFKSLGIHFWIYMALIAICIMARVIYDFKNKKIKQMPRMLFGFLALMVAFGVGGLLSPYYTWKSTVYGIGVAASMMVPYLACILLIDFSRMKKEYYAYVLIGLGICLSMQVINCLIPQLDAIKEGGYSYLRSSGYDFIRTGSCMRNNLGGMLALSLIGPLYLCMKAKWYYPFYFLLTFFFFIMVLLTGSQGATVAAMVMGIISILFVFFYNCRKCNPFTNVLALVFIIGIIVVSYMTIHKSSDSFSNWIKQLLDDDLSGATHGRIDAWKQCLTDFKDYPICGTSFYHLGTYIDYNFSYGIFPPRAHNTYLQILGSTGLVGVIGYVWHRFDTCKLMFKRMTMEKFFILLTYGVFFLISMVDCHFFNIGPGLLYGISCAFLEGYDREELRDKFSVRHGSLTDGLLPKIYLKDTLLKGLDE